MPELSNNFLKGRMNKDLDDRLVPRGEYRDALNVEVSTSESSDMGTVQNLKGNNNISEDVFKYKGLGNLFDAENGDVYTGNTQTASGTLSNDGDGVVVQGFDEIYFNSRVPKDQDDSYKSWRTTDIISIGKEYTVTFDVEIDLTKYFFDDSYIPRVGIIGVSSSLFETNIKTKHQVLIPNDDDTTGVLTGSITCTFFAATPYIEIYANNSFAGYVKNVHTALQTTLVSEINNAVTVGSKEDTATDTIYNFVCRASDLKTNVVTNLEGKVLTRKLGIVSDCIMAHKPDFYSEESSNNIVFTDVHEVRIAPRKKSDGSLPMADANGSPTPTIIKNIPYIYNTNTESYEVEGIRPGMKVSLLELDQSGSLIQDYWALKEVLVKSVYYDANSQCGCVEITNPNSTDLYNNFAIENNWVLQFTSKKILNFSSGIEEKELNVNDTPKSFTPSSTIVNNIDVVDNIMYFTTGVGEPKKINIDRFTAGTRNIYNHTQLVSEEQSGDRNFFVEEKHVTVIKAKPTSAPRLVLNHKIRKGKEFIRISVKPNSYSVFDTYDGVSVSANGDVLPSMLYSANSSTQIGGTVVGTNAISQIDFLDENNEVLESGTELTITSSQEKVNWREDDILKLTGQVGGKEVFVRIIRAYSNDFRFDQFKVQFLSAESTYTGGSFSQEYWFAELDDSKSLYEKNFISFAIRYKYDNNEYSAIGPYSEPAFLTSTYNYDATTGFNSSVENVLKSFYIKDFVPSDIHEDVKSVDIILKDHFTTNAYLVKTINKQDPDWNIPGSGNSKGSIEIKSELKGTTIPSLQLSRVFDAVPTDVKCQSLVSSRLSYANYCQGYNLTNNGGVPVTFSAKANFESFVNRLAPDGSEILGNLENDLGTSCEPFFDTNALSRNFIHNFFKNNNDSHFNQSTYETPAEDIRYWTSGGVNTDEGVGPRVEKILMPIIPKNEGNNSSVHVFPSMIDGASTNSIDQGALGNYQDYNITPQSLGYADGVWPYNTGAFTPNDLSSDITPFIYRVPTNGDYDILVRTKALARYYFGTSPQPSGSIASVWKFYRNQKCRIELHKVNASGVSQGIITDSLNLLNESSNSNTPYSGYAVSDFSVSENAVNYGFHNQTKVLTDFRTSQETPGSIDPSVSGNANFYDDFVDLELNRRITVSASNDISQNDYIGVFFVFAKSWNESANTSTFPSPYGPTLSFGGVNYSYTPNIGPEVRFAIDGNETILQINAPNTVEGVQVYEPSKSIKSNRAYELGVTYSDLYGRESNVLVSDSLNFEITDQYSDKRNIIVPEILSEAPYWATHYKYYIKEPTNKFFNIAMYKAYANEDIDNVAYAWLSFNSNDIDKVKVDDYLIAKKKHGSNIARNNSSIKFKVLDISNSVPTTVINGDTDLLMDITGEDASGKFFVKVYYTNLKESISELTDNEQFFEHVQSDANVSLGAVFEVEPKINTQEGFFWESSKAYPIKLNRNNVDQYIQEGDRIQIDSIVVNENNNSSTQDVGDWNHLNSHIKVSGTFGAISFPNVINDNYENLDELCVVNLSSNVTDIGDSYNSDSDIVVRFVKDDGSFVTGKAVRIYQNKIYLIPYTHQVSSTQEACYNKIGLPWYNCFQWYNGVESDTISDSFIGMSIYPYTGSGKTSGFNANYSFPEQGSPLSEVETYGQGRELGKDLKKNSIIWSQLRNASSRVDGTNQFILADKITKRINPSHGQINALIPRNNDVIVICEDKVLKVLSSGKNALFNADGNSQLIASNAVMGQSIPFTGEYGCQHPESITVDEYRVYFVDRARGSVLRLSKDGLTPISSIGMVDWFSDHLKSSMAIIGSIDDKKSHYNITMHETINLSVDKNVYTLSFNETTDGWTSFKSYIKETGLSLNNKYYTFKNGRLYLHHSDLVPRNNFYGVQYDSTVTSLINMQPSIVKAFSTVKYEGSQARINKSITDDRYDNVEQKYGWEVELIKTDMQEGVVEEFVEKEGKWYNNVKGKKE